MSDEIEKVTITGKEYHALNRIRGLTKDAFYMVVRAQEQKDGRWVLEGSEKTLDQLASDVAEEIEYRISPGVRLRDLKTLYFKLTPDSELF
jgi:predicted NAD/FAD-binding protein